jgi:hypothetical protein
MTTDTTHKQVIKHRMQATKGEICKLLCLTPDAYETMRYDLAIAWLEYQGYFEVTARIYILSKTFFNWWYQRLYTIECQFLQNYSRRYNANVLRNQYMNQALTLKLRPSRIVMEAIRNEGLQALERNPKLKTTKIFAE